MQASINQSTPTTTSGATIIQRILTTVGAITLVKLGLDLIKGPRNDRWVEPLLRGYARGHGGKIRCYDSTSHIRDAAKSQISWNRKFHDDPAAAPMPQLKFPWEDSQCAPDTTAEEGQPWSAIIARGLDHSRNVIPWTHNLRIFETMNKDRSLYADFNTLYNIKFFESENLWNRVRSNTFTLEILFNDVQRTGDWPKGQEVFVTRSKHREPNGDQMTVLTFTKKSSDFRTEIKCTVNESKSEELQRVWLGTGFSVRLTCKPVPRRRASE